ncbi:uncharacterized protein BDZ99DRAFT_521903 [Mytilinidion resinicola]|uniref:Uncharacterized protein n=1 Tax=Mytilinidion resinicola TaxID=574789 RepID=A0A6A6YHP5_9PEZI|nr:uncharacterized protein BDZ99DRAFT_521903 [Mytilinidion resinicola]KAF2808346.1 hypothetical protein BDZ99DRAFT_521903 [Mytilinidion resinicola]
MPRPGIAEMDCRVWHPANQHLVHNTFDLRDRPRLSYCITAASNSGYQHKETIENGFPTAQYAKSSKLLTRIKLTWALSSLCSFGYVLDADIHVVWDSQLLRNIQDASIWATITHTLDTTTSPSGLEHQPSEASLSTQKQDVSPFEQKENSLICSNGVQSK